VPLWPGRFRRGEGEGGDIEALLTLNILYKCSNVKRKRFRRLETIQLLEI
jgi:hypothetical protein